MTIDAAFWGTEAKGIAELERQLMRLRRAQSAHAREQGRTLARAAVLNLVVYAEREAAARRAARSVADLASRHPSRAIVLLADRSDAGDGVDTQIQMRCHVPTATGMTQVSYEQILVLARGDADDRLASALIPLLVPDLPVFLWWTGSPPVQASVFEQVTRLADRLVVDSADFARPEEMLPDLARICDRAKGRFGITDLNWTRLTPWREVVASFFDVPAWRPFLDAVTGVRVGFAVDMDGRQILPSQALLLIGWLASQLQWRPHDALAPSEAGGMLFTISRRDGAAIQVRVRPRFERGLEAGDVSGIRLQAERGGVHAEFVVKREPNPRHQTATVLIDGERRWERTLPLPSPEIVKLVGEELAIVGSDQIYEAALDALVRLA